MPCAGVSSAQRKSSPRPPGLSSAARKSGVGPPGRQLFLAASGPLLLCWSFPAKWHPRWRARVVRRWSCFCAHSVVCSVLPTHTGRAGRIRNLTRAAAATVSRAAGKPRGAAKGARTFRPYWPVAAGGGREESCGNPCASPGAVCTHLPPFPYSSPLALFCCLPWRPSWPSGQNAPQGRLTLITQTSQNACCTPITESDRV